MGALRKYLSGYLKIPRLITVVTFFLAAISFQARSETAPSISPAQTVPTTGGWYQTIGHPLFPGYSTGQQVCDALALKDNEYFKTDFVYYFRPAASGYGGTCIRNQCCGGFDIMAWPYFTHMCPPGYNSPNSGFTIYPETCVVNASAINQCPAVAAGETPYTLDPGGQTCSRPDQCLPPNSINQNTGKCEPPENYTITLIPERPSTEPSTALGFTVQVTKQNNQSPGQPVTIHLALTVNPTSGGHPHGGSERPRGGLNNTTCTSDAPCIDVSTSAQNTGTSGFTFHPTDASGTHTITPSCDRCSGKAVNVDVKMDGLHTITAKPWLYAFVGGEPDKQHHDSHYLTDNAFKQLTVLAMNYHFLYPNDPILHLNDASLVWGGLFDKDGDWDTPHEKHRRGVVIDIRANQINEQTSSNPGSSIPDRLFTDFIDLAGGTKIELNSRVISAKAKLHCSEGFDPATNCVGDINRHFHVRLLGVEQ